MVKALYNPFQNLNFSKNTCFLSGEKLSSPSEEISVFPAWLLEKYQLQDKAFKLLDESLVTYKDLKLPCSATVAQQIQALDTEIAQAFTAGYQAVKALPSIKLFQWIGKLVYGILYNEISIGIRQQQISGEVFNLSQAMRHKFSNLHAMLQSLIRPIEFDENLPWSIRMFPVHNNPEVFNYRDEINTLTFSLALNDFGLIACLQDNGTNAIYHRELLEKVDGKLLQPIQYEELIARFYYSNYLFNRLPEYTIMPTAETVYIEAMPLRGISNKPLFDDWQVKTYGQVLENFWKPWGYTLFEIIKDPENPMSYLLDENGEFKPLAASL